MTVLPPDREERLRARFTEHAGKLLGADPVCCGRVCTGTIEAIAEHAIGVARMAVRGDRLDRRVAKQRGRK